MFFLLDYTISTHIQTYFHIKTVATVKKLLQSLPWQRIEKWDFGVKRQNARNRRVSPWPCTSLASQQNSQCSIFLLNTV